MELYFGHKGYIYTCNILNPEQIQTKLNDNINQYIHTGNILFEITNIETITGQILPHESKFKLHQSLSIFIKFFKTKKNVFYDEFTKNKLNLKNDPNPEQNYYKIDKNIIKLFESGYSGEHKIYHENGNLLCEFYHINGDIEGIYKEYDVDGNIEREIQFVNNKKYGYYKRYYKAYNKNVLLEEKYYVDDILDGKSIRYFTNGQIEEIIHYKSGKKDGEYKLYYNRLKPFLIINYKSGKRDGLYQKYNHNFRLIVECNYINDKIDGIYKTFQVPYNCNDNYYLDHEIEYVNGKRCGKHITYDKFNKIKQIIIYIDDIPIEKHIKFDNNNNVIEKLFYKHNKCEKNCTIYNEFNKIVEIIDYKNKRTYLVK